MGNGDGFDEVWAGDTAALAAAFDPGTFALRTAIAHRLRASSDDIVREVLRATEGHDDVPLSATEERTARYRQAAHLRRATELLAGWIGTGAMPTAADLAPLAEVGRWVAESPVPIARVVRAGRATRAALWAVVRDEAQQQSASVTVALGLRTVVDMACDTMLQLVAQQYDQRDRAVVAELAAKEREMAHRALHDPLTGLANRVLLFDRLSQVSQRAKRHPTVARPALLFIDLDSFKAVNDDRGHTAGDAILRLLARRMTGAVRPEDTVARLGGDEFVVLCEAIPHRGWAVQLAGRVLAAIQAPIVDGDSSVVVGASIGVAVGDQPGWDPDRLLSEADHAMYRAKQQGPGRIHASWLADAPPRPGGPPLA